MQDEELYQRIKDGSYYEDGRDWYSMVYMSLMSERFFFIMLSSLALTALFLAVVSFFSILPLKPIETFLYENPKGATHFAHLRQLRESKDQSVNAAVRQFMLEHYVTHRESYERAKYGFFVKVVQQNSDDNTFKSYRRTIDRSNPNSPITLYGAASVRTVTIESLRIKPVKDEENRYTASVNYAALVRSPKGNNVSDWTAEVEFYYKDVSVVDADNTDISPDDPVEISPMEFKVTDYRTNLRNTSTN